MSRFSVVLLATSATLMAEPVLVPSRSRISGIPISAPTGARMNHTAAESVPVRVTLNPDTRVVLTPGGPKADAASEEPAPEDGWVNIKTEDFEGVFPNEWALYGDPTWDDESYRPHNGSWSGYCVGSSVSPPGPYPPDADAWMVYGPFSLVGATQAEFSFYRWVVTEEDYDFLYWGWSTDGLNFLGYSVSGSHGSWTAQTCDIDTACAEDSVWIAFYFHSDESSQYEGAYIDDIVLRKYTETGQPDLAPHAPSGWDYPIVPSNVRGTNQVPGVLLPEPDTTFVDWAVINQGAAATTDTFYIYLYQDGVPFQGWYVAPPFDPGYYVYVEDFPRLVASGNHTLMVFADSTNAIAESSETNNRWSHTWSWTSSEDYDHVVVTSSALSSSFAPLCSFIESHLGLNDTTVTVEAIYSTFPGRDNPEKIRNFIKHAVDNWSTTHVLLGGDVDRVPCRYAYGRVISTTEYLPCDLYYSDLDGDWDADGDSIFGEPTDDVDMYPDVFVGRAPVSTTAEVGRFVSRFSSYSSDSTDPYLLEVLLGGFDLDEYTYGESTMEFYEDTYIPSQMVPCNKVYDSHGGNHRTAMLGWLNAGQHIWVHTDHGNIDLLGCGDRNHGWDLYNSDMDALTNGTDYTILMSMACLCGGFDSSDCFTEHFMLAPYGGGVAAMTNSRSGWYYPRENPQRSLSAAFVEWVNRALFSHLGNGCLEDFAIAKAHFVPLADTNMTYRWCMYTFNLFGEPAMNVWVPTQVAIARRAGSPRLEPGSGLSAASHFDAVTELRFALPKEGHATLCVFDQAGRRVNTLVEGPLAAGCHTTAWNGCGDDGRVVATGIYYARLATPSGTSTVKLVKTGKD